MSNDSKPLILVSKTGGTVYMPDTLHLQTPTSEQGATAGLLRWLGACGKYRVVFHGLWRGTLPEGITGVPFDVSGVTPEKMGPVEHERRCRQELERVLAACGGERPGVWVNVVGYSPSVSCAWNPWQADVLTAAMRYVAPAISVAGWLGLPRIVLNADLRCYPREGEMGEMWPTLRPAALFSQVTKDWNRVTRLHDRRFRVREIACGMENWHTLGRELPAALPQRDVDLCVMSHAHVTTGFGKFSDKIGQARDAIWRKLLLPNLDWLRDEATAVIYGCGWEGLDYAPDWLLHGPISPCQVIPELQRARCGLVVTPWGRDPYVTSKVRYHAWAGCVPVMYGHWREGEDWVPHAGDGVGRYARVSDGPPYRCNDAAELRQCVEYWRDRDAERMEYARDLDKATAPRFDVFEECVDAVLAGADTSTEEWHEKFGGYREVTR